MDCTIQLTIGSTVIVIVKHQILCTKQTCWYFYSFWDGTYCCTVPAFLHLHLLVSQAPQQLQCTCPYPPPIELAAIPV